MHDQVWVHVYWRLEVGPASMSHRSIRRRRRCSSPGCLRTDTTYRSRASETSEITPEDRGTWDGPIH